MQAIPLLQAALDAVRAGQTTPASFCRAARAHATQLPALPARYIDVLHQLLDRLEAGALFSEESCSFSQQDLVDNLQAWIDQASLAAARAGAAPGSRTAT